MNPAAMNAPADLAKASASKTSTPLERGRVFLTGTQALIRLLMLQRERDLRAGPEHRRASSPATAARRSAASTRRCGARRSTSRATTSSSSPGVNEDLAATAIWGTQQVGMFPGAKYDGVLRHVVRQGPGRRPLRRRVQARQRRRHLEARRRAGARRRRPRARSPRRCRTSPSTSSRPACIPVLNPVQRAGLPRPRPARLRDEPLLGLLDRLQVRHRRRRIGRFGRSSIRTASGRRCPTTSRCLPAG